MRDSRTGCSSARSRDSCVDFGIILDRASMPPAASRSGKWFTQEAGTHQPFSSAASAWHRSASKTWQKCTANTTARKCGPCKSSHTCRTHTDARTRARTHTHTVRERERGTDRQADRQTDRGRERPSGTAPQQPALYSPISHFQSIDRSPISRNGSIATTQKST